MINSGLNLGTGWNGVGEGLVWAQPEDVELGCKGNEYW